MSKCDVTLNPCHEPGCDKCHEFKKAMHDDLVDEIINMFAEDDITLVRVNNETQNIPKDDGRCCDDRGRHEAGHV